MNNLSQTIGLLGNILIITAVLTKFIPLQQYSNGVRIALLLAFVFIGLIPINNLVVVGYLRGGIGDPSIMTMLLVSSYLIRHYTQLTPIPDADFKIMMLAYAAIGIAYYPFALGISLVDPYAWGYGSIWAGLAVLAVCTLLIRIKLSVACILVTLCVIAYLLKVLESRNLWDYLIDPMLWVYAIIYAVMHLLITPAREKRQS